MSKTMEGESVETIVHSNERELLDQLLKPEVQQSLTVLVEQLPQITELVQKLSKFYDTIKSLSTDEVLKNETFEAMHVFLEPAKQSIRQMAQNFMEARERAEKSNEVIGLFGLLRMIKDPQVQKCLRFMHSYLQIVAEKEAEMKK